METEHGGRTRRDYMGASAVAASLCRGVLMSPGGRRTQPQPFSALSYVERERRDLVGAVNSTSSAGMPFESGSSRVRAASDEKRRVGLRPAEPERTKAGTAGAHKNHNYHDSD